MEGWDCNSLLNFVHMRVVMVTYGSFHIYKLLNTKNGHPSQISPKLDSYNIYVQVIKPQYFLGSVVFPCTACRKM